MNELYNDGNYDAALDILSRNDYLLDDYFDREVIATSFSSRIDGGNDYVMAITGDKEIRIAIDCDGYTWLVNPHAWAEGENPIQVSTDGYKMAVLYKDGRVNCESTYGSEIDTTSWKDIVRIATGCDSVFGITRSGKIKVTGKLQNSSWEKYDNVENVLVGGYEIAIRYRDGTVITLDGTDKISGVKDSTIAGEKIWGINSDNELIGNNMEVIDSPEEWKNLIMISGSEEFLVALKKDGTVIYQKLDGYTGISNVEDWENIVSIVAGDEFVIGITEKGEVKFAGSYPNDTYEISDYNFYTGNEHEE